jgi:hypothetical protein
MAKSKVLVLGAGFSKAFDNRMPLLKEIADYFYKFQGGELKHWLEEQVKEYKEKFDPVRALHGLPIPELLDLFKEPYQTLLTQPESFELLLTYLSQEQPWKSNFDILRDQALFTSIAEHLGVYLEKCQQRAFQEACIRQTGSGESPLRIPSWLSKLSEYLIQNKIHVITFNYDTVIEWALLCTPLTNGKNPASYVDAEIYGLRLSLLEACEGEPFSKFVPQSFKLIKLHGSINWFYSGFSSGEVYYYPIRQDPAVTCSLDSIKGKERFIIPPILNKAALYDHQIIRSLWRDAKFYLEQADEIVCIGYSMPLTDLTTRLLFQSLSKFSGKTVYVVNIAQNQAEADELIKRYKTVFPQQIVDKRFLLPPERNPVERMVEFLADG